MAFLYLLLLLVPVGIAAYLVWDHKRKVAERAAASAERLHALLGAETYIPPAEPVSRAPSPQPPASAPAVTPAATTAAPAYAARERLLTPPETLLYYLLRTGLPDHVIFAQVTLRAVLEAAPGLAGYARNEQMRRLSWHALDFVVCDRNVRPVAVVELARRGEDDETSSLRQSWIVSAGLRYIALEPTALPRKEAIRGVVLGEAEPAIRA